jgi:hypothetical protein
MRESLTESPREGATNSFLGGKILHIKRKIGNVNGPGHPLRKRASNVLLHFDAADYFPAIRLRARPTGGYAQQKDHEANPARDNAMAFHLVLRANTCSHIGMVSTPVVK